MPRHLFSLAAVLSLACPAATLMAQGTFEGVMTIRLAAARNGGEMTYSVKGDQLRVDMGMAGTSMYMLRTAKDESFIVMPAQRIYMSQPPMSAPDVQTLAEKKNADVKMTGRKETIAGYECEHMLITGADGQVDACIAKGLGAFRMPGAPGRGAAPPAAWEGVRNSFPLKVQNVGGDVLLEVTKIEKKPLANSVFTVPDDYKKMDMGMGRGGRPPRD